MSKFTKELWGLWVERHKIHKALRILNKQTWSVEFLTALLVRAANASHQQLAMTITGPGGIAVHINTIDDNAPALQDDNVFNHLDDDVYIKQFMESINHGVH
jgi:hypothetical protein